MGQEKVSEVHLLERVHSHNHLVCHKQMLMKQISVMLLMNLLCPLLPPHHLLPCRRTPQQPRYVLLHDVSTKQDRNYATFVTSAPQETSQCRSKKKDVAKS